jgi:polysaccharide pyruvyl transferase WcaK-like protein
MNIAILNAEAGGNKGAEAMLEVLIIKLLNKYPDVTLYLEVSSKEKYYRDIFLKKFQNKNIKILLFTPKNILKPYNLDIKCIDCAIDIGGINFHGGLNRGSFRNLARFFPFINNKIKLLFFTQDIGPSEKKLNTKMGRYILSKSNGIFTRSETSFNQVINNFKIDREKVFGPFPDSTLLYKTSDVYDGKLKENYIVLTPSAIMFTRHGIDYIKLFVKLYELLKDKYQVVILVHNFTSNFNNSDLDICSKLHNLCPTSVLINENISTGKLKNILGNSKFSISSRYHVIVGSISQDIPSIAIGWNPKYESFLKLYNKKYWNIDFGSNSFKEIKNLLENKEFTSGINDLAVFNQTLKQNVSESFNQLFSNID